jgi:hypothetical protein
MKRSARAAVIAVVMGVLIGLVALPANAHGPYCGIRWGSLPKDLSASSTGYLANVRAGRHKCFDRLVLDVTSDVAGDPAGYFVRYVDQVRADGSGQLIPIRGGARVAIVATAPAYNVHGESTYQPRNRSEIVNVKGWRTFRQVAWGGSFEGQTTVGLGVRARLPFRAFHLDGPANGSRIVVDVAHRW